MCLGKWLVVMYSMYVVKGLKHSEQIIWLFKQRENQASSDIYASLNKNGWQ